MTSRPRHPDKEFEKLILEAEQRGWERRRGKGYYQVYCPCGAHIVNVVLTPSSQRTIRNTRAKFRRAGCWEEGER